MLYDPDFLNSSINIANDRQTLNSWYKGLYNNYTIVSDTIDFYTHYPAKFLSIGEATCPNVDNFFQEQIGKLDLTNTLLKIFNQFWLIGECYTYAHLNEEKKMWNDLIIQNPDYIIVQRSILGGQSTIYLRPDEVLRTLVLKTSPSEEEQKILSKLDTSIIDSIRTGNNILLNNFYTSAFIRLKSPYDIRGTSLLRPILRTFMLLEKYKAENILPEEQNKLIHEIKTTLGHPESLLYGINREIVRLRIDAFMQNTIVPWLKQKIFSPIAKINDFYEYKDRVKHLVIPSVNFDSQAFQISLEKDSSSIFPSN